jgi:predicted secreted protein
MANHSFGTTLTWDSVSVAGLTAINGVDVSADTVEVSNHLSADAYKEYLVGMIEPGELSVEGQFDYTDTTGQHAMLADLNGRAAKTWTITFPSATGATWTGSGFLVGFKVGDATLDNAIPFSARVKLTGKPTFAVTASTGLTTPFFAISESAVVTPDEAGDVYEYVATVLTGVSSVTVTPTATAGTITVNGNTVATGEASSAIALGAAGTVTEITIVVTETGKSPKTYTIWVARAAA